MALASTAAIEVTVKKIDPPTGKIQIALVKKKENFPPKEKPYRARRIKIDGQNEIRHIFREIPKGTYAISVFHDENEDNELNTNFLGIPVEDFGFSNNVMGSFGPPDFDEASFLLKENSHKVQIDLKSAL